MSMKLNSLLLTAALFGAMGAVGTNKRYDNQELNNRKNYEGKGFSGGQPIMREFIIKGKKIMATNKKMAIKKYNLLNS